MTNSADPDQLASEPDQLVSDLDLHCFQGSAGKGFSMVFRVMDYLLIL